MASRITTAAELDAMTPAERQANFDASIVRDLSQVPAGHLARLRARVEERLSHSDTTQDVPHAS